jgi:hypothetical protein
LSDEATTPLSTLPAGAADAPDGTRRGGPEGYVLISLGVCLLCGVGMGTVWLGLYSWRVVLATTPVYMLIGFVMSLLLGRVYDRLGVGPASFGRALAMDSLSVFVFHGDLAECRHEVTLGDQAINPEGGRFPVRVRHPPANGFLPLERSVTHERPFRILGAERQETFVVAPGDGLVGPRQHCLVRLRHPEISSVEPVPRARGTAGATARIVMRTCRACRRPQLSSSASPMRIPSGPRM